MALPVGAIKKGLSAAAKIVKPIAEKAAPAAKKAGMKMGSIADKADDLLTGGGGIKNWFYKDIESTKVLENLSPLDRSLQRAFHIADVTEDGIQFKQLTARGMLTAAGVQMAVSTGKAIQGQAGSNTRGLVEAADNLERFVSYDGSGFVNNVADVAGGDPEVMNDIINHTFSSQRSVFNDNSLNDIVFALHKNREG